MLNSISLSGRHCTLLVCRKVLFARLNFLTAEIYLMLDEEPASQLHFSSLVAKTQHCWISHEDGFGQVSWVSQEVMTTSGIFKSWQKATRKSQRTKTDCQYMFFSQCQSRQRLEQAQSLPLDREKQAFSPFLWPHGQLHAARVWVSASVFK